MARTAERGAQVLALASIMVMCRCAKWAWGVHREEQRGWLHARALERGGGELDIRREGKGVDLLDKKSDPGCRGPGETGISFCSGFVMPNRRGQPAQKTQNPNS